MLYPAVYIRVIMERMILSELADVDSRLSLERGNGNQHPPLNSCHGIGHSVEIPVPVRTHHKILVCFFFEPSLIFDATAKSHLRLFFPA